MRQPLRANSRPAALGLSSKSAQCCEALEQGIHLRFFLLSFTGTNGGAASPAKDAARGLRIALGRGGWRYTPQRNGVNLVPVS